jgi:hypothetical protein
MQDFKRAMVFCAAISCFTGGAYTTLAGVDALGTSRVKQVIAAELAAGRPQVGVVANDDNAQP